MPVAICAYARFVATMPTALASAQGAGKEGRDLAPRGEQAARDGGGGPERGCLGLMMGGREGATLLPFLSSFKHSGGSGFLCSPELPGSSEKLRVPDALARSGRAASAFCCSQIEGIFD